MKNLKLMLLLILFSTSLFAGKYTVDASHSNIGFTIKHMMISNVVGKFDKFSGSFVYDEEIKKLQSVEGKIFVSSINTSNLKRDNHLKNEEMFFESKYPTIIFKSTKIEGDNLYGDLTIKGITKNIKLKLEYGGHIGNKSAFSALGKISRSEFGITWNKVLEGGEIVVGDEVKLVIDIEGDLIK